MALPTRADQKAQQLPLENKYINRLMALLLGDLDFHNQRGDYATHNFHSFPAKFPPQLPRLFIEGLTEEGEVVLDAMAGSGTSIVEAYLANRRAVGFDIDPLALNIIQVKTTPAEPAQLMQVARGIIERAKQSIQEQPEALKAEIQKRFDEETRDFLNHWFLPVTQIELQALIREIQQIGDQATRTFFEVAFSAIIITKSGGVSIALDLGHTRPHLAKKVVDRAGNVLLGNEDENVPAYSTKILRPVLPEFEKRCLQNLDGILRTAGRHYPVDVQFGDAQKLPLLDDSVHLIVTSPPYASNAIDYMRAHKFSLVWLGHAIHDLGQRRKDYIGGESITNFQFEALPYRSQQVVNSIKELDKSKAASLHRYYSEMTRVLREMYRVLAPERAAIVVVGNSVMRGIDTEIPQCLAEIGASLGFAVPLIGVRQLDRDKRMMPAGTDVNLQSQIQQRMHEEYVIGFYKP
jgi:DNA modification methylase